MKPTWLPRSLVVATHNPGKLAEWRALLEPLAVRVHAPASFCLPVPEETEPDYRGNAVLKATAAAQASGMAALADDTGFEADALKGAPGVLTAGWAAEHGGYPEALHALLARAPAGSRARLVCAVAVVAGERTRTAQAQISGTIRVDFSEAPGFAAMLQPDGHEPLVLGGVLAHRREAFGRLLADQ